MLEKVRQFYKKCILENIIKKTINKGDYDIFRIDFYIIKKLKSRVFQKLDFQNRF